MNFFFQKSADMGISSEGNMGAWVCFPLPVRTDADGYFEQFEPPEFVDAETENEDAETDIIQIDIEDDEEDEI